MTGLPCTGKSTIAAAVANALHAPIYSVDPLEGVLLKGGIGPELRSDYLAYDLAAMLAEEQMRRGESAVVDAVNALNHLRTWFLGLAERHGQPSVLIETRCSDPAQHRRRLEARSRDIDGYDVQLTWPDIAKRAEEWEEPTIDHLILDAGDDLHANIQAATAYVSRQYPR